MAAQVLNTDISVQSRGNRLVDWVNPLQGTDSHHGFSQGNTLPLVAMPFGMTHWCPQTREAGQGWFFHPDDYKIEGIRATHQPSPWIGDYGHFIVMPQTGDLQIRAGARASAYRRESAIFTPYHFQAYLERFACLMDFVPTERCAVLRVRFDTDDDPTSAALCRRILVQPGAGIAHVEVVPGKRMVRGWTRSNSGGVPENFALYFVAHFDADFSDTGVFTGNNVIAGESEAEGERAGAYVEFGASADARTIEVRIATSFISWEQAETNAAHELQGDFDTLRDRAEATWEETLGRLHVTGGSPEHQCTLYSCLYRTQLFPRDFHEYDTDGKAVHYSPYTGEVRDGRLVTDNGFWDTYRTVYPFYSLFCPDKLSHILDGWLTAYRESDWLPTWASPGHRLCMVGTHADAVFADAMVKGIGSFDRNEAYEALRKHAFVVVDDDTGFGRLGLADYLERGFVPHDHVSHASASRTVDYAYDDFCVAQVARLVGRDEDAQELETRALNWRHVFDSEVGMLRGRNADGSWRTPWDEFEWGGPFVEGGPWQHTWAVPHDPTGLVNILGGAPAFTEKLQRMLTLPSRFRSGSYGFEIHEMTEMAAAPFGQYAHSNQPVHHALYLFACAGRPDLTQHYVRRVLTELYSPDALPGDEDNGEMAAWYVFSAALGLYPLCPGHPSYVLGCPLFPEAQLTLSEGRVLKVHAEVPPGLSITDCPYVAEVTWRGEIWPSLWISHEALTGGGELRFRLSDTPPAPRSYTAEEQPFSLTR